MIALHEEIAVGEVVLVRRLREAVVGVVREVHHRETMKLQDDLFSPPSFTAEHFLAMLREWRVERILLVVFVRGNELRNLVALQTAEEYFTDLHQVRITLEKIEGTGACLM